MNYIAYYRVSTRQQAISGLGLDAQRSLVVNYIANLPEAKLLNEFTEAESGKKNNREQLALAIQHCELSGATLVVSKLDRLSRDLHFLTSVMQSNLKFVCADNPSANTLTLGILAVIAENERKVISERTKVALAAAKERGIKLGNPRFQEEQNKDPSQARESYQKQTKEFNASLIPVIHNLQKQGVTSLKDIAAHLNDMGFKARRGGKFHPSTIHAALKRP